MTSTSTSCSFVTCTPGGIRVGGKRDSGGQREARVERRRRGRQQRARGPRGERDAGGGERGDDERDEGAAHRTWLISGSVDESGSSSTGAKVMSSKRAK